MSLAKYYMAALEQSFIELLEQSVKLKVTLLSRMSKQRENQSDCNWTRTQNHLVRKRTLNHLASNCNWTHRGG